VIDVTVSYEDDETLASSATEKYDKQNPVYGSVACLHLGLHPISVVPLVLDSMGNIPPETKMALMQLGFSRKETGNI
jgi:hypothetical protein